MPTMSQNDFDKLCQSIKDSVSAFTKMVPDAASSFSQTIKDSVSTFTKNLNDGLGEAGNAFNEGLGQAFGKDSTPKPSEAPKQTGFSSPTAQQNPATPVATNARSAAPVPFVNNSLARSRFRSSMGLSISGVILIILGAAGTFAFGLTSIIGPLAATFVPGTFVAGEIGCLVLTGLSIACLVWGLQRLSFGRKVNTFRRIFGNREVCTFQELSARAQISPSKALSTARKLIKRGFLPQGRIDDENTCLMVTEDAYRLYQQAELSRHQRELEESAENERRQKQQDALKDAGAKAVALVDEGRRYLPKLHELDAAIDDEELSAKIVTIEDLLERIIERVEEEPDVVDRLDYLTDYYLPTTVKLLSAYESLEEQPIQGENIMSSRREIEQTLDALCLAYAKLLDSTFQDLSMDISSDAAVLRAILAQEGLTESPFDIGRRSKPSET